jgi:hypothetical protein
LTEIYLCLSATPMLILSQSCGLTEIYLCLSATPMPIPTPRCRYLEAQPALASFELPDVFSTGEAPLSPLAFCLSVTPASAKKGLSPALCARENLASSPCLSAAATRAAVGWRRGACSPWVMAGAGALPVRRCVQAAADAAQLAHRRPLLVGGESFVRVHWVAVPQELRARRVNRRPTSPARA